MFDLKPGCKINRKKVKACTVLPEASLEPENR
jgi:hypothetical protein